MSVRSAILILLLLVNVAVQNGVGVAIIPGPRQAYVYYESAQDTPTWKATVQGLRVGEPAKYLADKGTVLEIRDVGEGRPQPDPTLPLPSLYVQAGETTVYKGPCPKESAQAVVEVIKSHGG